MRAETRRTIHMGVNFILAPLQNLDNQRFFQFQQRLAEEKVEITQANRTPNQFALARQGPPGLQIQVQSPTPPAGQLLIISAVDPASQSVQAGISADAFEVEARTIADVFSEVWPETQQVLARDAAVRMLFDCGGVHAFKYLWEQRLRQQEEGLKGFGRPVQGGGLRLVFPPTEEQHSLIEVKIESFLADASKIFLEAIMQWPEPRAATDLGVSQMIEEVEQVNDRLVAFLNEN